ncbi:MAG: DUF3486 family protein [Verrucomicrobiaceae bacterium]|nr:DUF3486 family protein [Verrucomicrobiaceae bacterium]
MARTGKIARLPHAVREELNMRLRENENGQTILEWLNALPQCQDAPINDANLSLWRSGGFADWLKDQDSVHKIEKLGELSVRLAKAAGGRMSKGFLAIAVGKIHEALEEGQSVEFNEQGKPVLTGVGVDKLAKALAAIAKIEQDDEKLDLDRSKHGLDQEKLALDKKRFQRETAELFIEFSKDEKAKEIATSDMAADTKLEALGKHLFGDAW